VECASPVGHDSTGSFPEMFLATAGPLEEVCALETTLKGIRVSEIKIIN
jgi:hypothetical protein